MRKQNGCGKWRWAAFPSASGPSVGSGRTEHARIFDSLQSELSVTVAHRSTSAPVRPRCPQTLAFGSSNRPMCVLAPQKCAGCHGHAQKLCWLIPMLSMKPCIESGTLSLRKRASATAKVFFVIFGVKCGFRGLLGVSVFSPSTSLS